MHPPYDVRMMQMVPLLLSRSTGGLDRPLTGNYAAVPGRIELRGRRLFYSRDARLRRVDTSRLLDRFVALADTSSEKVDIFAFAKRYGPLYLCEHHGLASYHKPPLMSHSPLGPAPILGIDEPFRYGWCGPRLERGNPEMFSEPIEAWRALARRAANLLLVANAVRLTGNASPQLWEQTDGFRGSFHEREPVWAYLDDPWSGWPPILSIGYAPRTCLYAPEPRGSH